MHFAALCRALGALGWTVSDREVRSPSGQHWFDEEALREGAVALYVNVACRFEKHSRRGGERDGPGPDSTSREYVHALVTLADDPDVRLLLGRFERAQTVISAWARTRDMQMSYWDYRSASMRGTSRTPYGHMVALEWVDEIEGPLAGLRGFRWVDDEKALTRTSWTTRVRTDLSVEALDETLREVLASGSPNVSALPR